MSGKREDGNQEERDGFGPLLFSFSLFPDFLNEIWMLCSVLLYYRDRCGKLFFFFLAASMPTKSRVISDISLKVLNKKHQKSQICPGMQFSDSSVVICVRKGIVDI